MNPQLKEKMQKAASDYLDERGSVINYEEDNYAAGAYDGFIAGATAMYAELAPLVEWISVKDRLPENQDIVLIKTDKNCICTAYLHGKESGFITYGDDAFIDFGNITHWRRIEL